MTTSMTTIKNMPVFVQEKEWLATVASIGYKRISKLTPWSGWTERMRDALRNKHRALGEAVRKQLWRDFDIIDITATEKECFEQLWKEVQAQEANAQEMKAQEVQAQEMKAQEVQAQTQDETADKPVWETNRYRRVCNSFRTGEPCIHMAQGKTCFFAHSIEQLKCGVIQCAYGDKCYRKEHGHHRPCECLHPGETVEELVDRLNLVIPLPLVCEEPVQKTTQETEQKAEQGKTIKRIYATEAEELRNMLFAANREIAVLQKKLQMSAGYQRPNLKIDIAAALKVESNDQFKLQLLSEMQRKTP